MLSGIQKKIAFIRSQPEEVRLRHLLMWLILSMFFIVLIWVFSVKESFEALTKQNTPVSKESVQKSTQSSLDSLLNSDQSLRIEGDPKNGEEYIQEQMRLKDEDPTGLPEDASRR